MRPLKALLSIAVVAVAVAACAPAYGGGGPTVLGQRTVAFGADYDVIRVGPGDRRFRAVRLHVSDSPMEMFDVRIRFGDGSSFSPSTRLRFEEGAWTRSIDLPGRARVIRTIEFRYRSIGPRSGRARVQAVGIR